MSAPVFIDPVDAAVARAFDRTKPVTRPHSAEHRAAISAGIRKTAEANREASAAFVRRWKNGLREIAMCRVHRAPPAKPNSFDASAAIGRFPYPNHRTCAEWMGRE